jgi:hypothetical protein
VTARILIVALAAFALWVGWQLVPLIIGDLRLAIEALR